MTAATLELRQELEEPLAREFTSACKALAARILETAKAHGFNSVQHEGISISLMHSELSEVLEAYRHGNPPSEKLPGFTSVEEELADVVIRVLDHAGARGHRVAEAVLAKMEYNEGRPFKHGGKAF
jgi:NTP pyrophosphatase (non-canonical NTP hydrolase)